MSRQVEFRKHLWVADLLGGEIRAGLHRPGQRLPGEHALASRFSVSRTTVRQALTELNRRGMIATQSGRGSFVTFDSSSLDERLGWSRALSDRAVPLVTNVLRIELIDDADLAETLSLPERRFVAVDRTRTVAGGPVVSYERSRIPAIAPLSDLPDRGLVDGSLLATLCAASLIPDNGEEWVELTRLTAEEAAILCRSEGSAFLRTRRLSLDAAGRFVEHVVSLLDPERFAVHLYLRPSR
jgi:GntR family transcriptional regulator